MYRISGARQAALCGFLHGPTECRSDRGCADASSGVEARILEFQPRWRNIELQDQSRLGLQFATLGTDLVAGRRVRIASDAFRVVIRADNFDEFEELLPSASRFAIAAEALDAFAPSHLEWDLTLEIDDSVVATSETRRALTPRLDFMAAADGQSWIAR